MKVIVSTAFLNIHPGADVRDPGTTQVALDMTSADSMNHSLRIYASGSGSTVMTIKEARAFAKWILENTEDSSST